MNFLTKDKILTVHSLERNADPLSSSERRRVPREIVNQIKDFAFPTWDKEEFSRRKRLLGEVFMTRSVICECDSPSSHGALFILKVYIMDGNDDLRLVLIKEQELFFGVISYYYHSSAKFYISTAIFANQPVNYDFYLD